MKLSIIIPTFNVEKHIENTLASLISQTDKDFEIVIVDDGSTDSTYQIAKSMMEKNEVCNFKIIKKVNGGVSSARNMGLAEAKGSYVMFLDGDDYISSNLVNTIKQNITFQNDDIICWGYSIVKENKTLIMNYFDKYSDSLSNMTGIDAIKHMFNGDMKIVVGTAVYRKKLLDDFNIRYTEGCANGEDQEFTYKCLSRSKKVLFISEILTYYVKRIGSISNSYNLKRFDSVFAMKRISEHFDKIDCSELKIITNYFKYERVINNYLGNLNDCFRYIDKNSNRKIQIRKLLDEIDENYPTLNQLMYDTIKSYNGKNSNAVILKVFLKSPVMYSYLLILRDRLRKYRKKLKFNNF